MTEIPEYRRAPDGCTWHCTACGKWAEDPHIDGTRITVADECGWGKASNAKGKASIPNIIICVTERDGGGIRISGNIDGLYVAGNDKDAVFRDFGVVLQKLLHHNEGFAWVKDEA